MSDQLGYDPSKFFVWKLSDGFAVHLSLKLVAQLSAQIAGAASEQQPGELRGILLGRTIEAPSRATVIEDFKPLAPGEDDTSGLRYSDDTLFEVARRMAQFGTGQRVLGFFRAQRRGDLKMGTRDLDTFSRLFCETGNIALLIQTPRTGAESAAVLYYWQDGEAHPREFGFGFPFNASQLASGHAGWKFLNPFDSAQPAEAPSSSREPIRWSRLLPTAALVIIGVGALQLLSNSNRSVAAAPIPAGTMQASTAPGGETALGLTVTSRPHQLDIRWYREAAAIIAASQGEMKITEDGTTEAVTFDQSQLRDGYVAYTPITNDVSIRLQVTGKDGSTTTESVRSVAIP